MIKHIITLLLSIGFILGKEVSIVEVNVGKLIFNCRTSGLSNNGDGIILLHGWPETSHMWVDLMELLSDKGFRVVAPDQRGYSPQARPNNINEYKIEKIVQDVFSIADSFEFEQFHLIGHDWGASIGWASTYTKPERIITWTAMSVPHLSAFGQALQSDNDQKKKSRYISFFKLPFLPEFYFSISDYKNLKNIWNKSSDEQIDAYLQVFKGDGALKASLNWYRANIDSKANNKKINELGNIYTPSQLIWGNKDMALGRRGAEMTGKYMKGKYQFIELDAGHWLIQDDYSNVSTSIVNIIEQHAIKKQ